MGSALDSSTDRNREYRKKQRELGGAHIGVVLKPGDEATMWNRLVFEQGGPTAALRHLLRQAMGRNDAAPTDEELIGLLAARLKAKGQDGPVRPEPVSAAKRPRKSS